MAIPTLDEIYGDQTRPSLDEIYGSQKPSLDEIYGQSSLLPSTPETPAPSALDAERNAPKQRSLPGDIGAGLSRGWWQAQDMIGGAQKAYSPVGSDTYRRGQEVQDVAKLKLENPDIRHGIDRGIIADTIIKGSEGVAQMAGPLALYAIPGIGIPLATAASGALYGGSTYQDTKERMLKQEGLDDVYAAAYPNDPRVEKAKLTGLGTGVVQGGLDAAATAVGGKFLTATMPSFGKATAKAVIDSVASPALNTVKKFMKGWLTAGAVEGVTEPVQDEMAAYIERQAGLKDAPAFMEQAADSAQGGVGTALLLGPLAGFGHANVYKKNRMLQQALSNPEYDTETRQFAADVVARGLEQADPSAAANFRSHAFDAIGSESETGTVPYGLDLENPELLTTPASAVSPSGPSPVVETVATPAADVPLPPTQRGTLTEALKEVLNAKNIVPEVSEQTKVERQGMGLSPLQGEDTGRGSIGDVLGGVEEDIFSDESMAKSRAKTPFNQPVVQTQVDSNGEVTDESPLTAWIQSKPKAKAARLVRRMGEPGGMATVIKQFQTENPDYSEVPDVQNPQATVPEVAPIRQDVPVPRELSVLPEEPTVSPLKGAGVGGEPDVAAKMPWEMTQGEFVSDYSTGVPDGTKMTQRIRDTFVDNHRMSVERALAEGKPVPLEVLIDYPDLVPVGKYTPPINKELQASIDSYRGQAPDAITKQDGLTLQKGDLTNDEETSTEGRQDAEGNANAYEGRQEGLLEPPNRIAERLVKESLPVHLPFATAMKQAREIIANQQPADLPRVGNVPAPSEMAISGEFAKFEQLRTDVQKQKQKDFQKAHNRDDVIKAAQQAYPHDGGETRVITLGGQPYTFIRHTTRGRAGGVFGGERPVTTYRMYEGDGTKKNISPIAPLVAELSTDEMTRSWEPTVIEKIESPTLADVPSVGTVTVPVSGASTEMADNVPKTLPPARKRQAEKAAVKESLTVAPATSGASASETKYQTGKPVKMGFIWNTEKSPNMGERFGQHIEPAGRYITERPSTFKGDDFPNMKEGEVDFKNPLVIDWGGGYGEPDNWKRVLSDKYGGKKGKALSSAIAKDGYDGIITLGKKGNTSEMVDLAPDRAVFSEAAKPLKQQSRLRNLFTDIQKAGGIKQASLERALDKNEIRGNKGKGNRYRTITGNGSTAMGVDQMAQAMKDAGWQVPTDLNGEVDANAFAQMLSRHKNVAAEVHPDDVDKLTELAELQRINEMAAEFAELDQDVIDNDFDEVDNYNESEEGGSYDFSQFDSFLEEISTAAPAEKTQAVLGNDEGKVRTQSRTETTDDAGGLKQQVVIEGDRKNATIGQVQKQGGKAVGTSDFMDGFTPNPEQDLFSSSPAHPVETSVSSEAKTTQAEVVKEAKQTAKQEGTKKEIPSEFGEHLGGARRDRQASLDKDYDDAALASMPFSEIWPKKELDAIEDTFTAAVSTAARAEVPSKPRQSYKVNRWVEKVKGVRSLAKMVHGLNREEFFDKAKEFRLEGFVAKVNLLENIDRSQWDRIGKVKEYPDAYGYVEGEQVARPHSIVEIDGKNVKMDTGTVAESYDKVKTFLEGDKAGAKMQFEVRGGGSKFFIMKKGDALYRPLMKFDNSSEALTFIRDKSDPATHEKHYAMLVQEWENLKERENVKERDLRREENRPRTSADYRKGMEATPQMFTDAFGFRGVEFGNWVTQGKKDKERQGMLNAAYDAMMDMSDIIGVPPQALSLNGTLGLGFGSRGSGWASAHYEPGTLVINLTKTRGAGALAHELFHAIDHFFQRQRTTDGISREQNYITYNPETYYQDTKSGQRLSSKRFNEIKERGRFNNINDWKPVEGVRPEVGEAFADLVKALDASPMNKRASLIDKGKSGGYWSRIIERAARSFENYVIFKMQQKGYHNDYLANVVTEQEFSRDIGRYPYLLESEIAPVAEAFDNLFATIKTKQTDKGTMLYSRATAPTTTTQTPDQFRAAAESTLGKPLTNSLFRLKNRDGKPLVTVAASMKEIPADTIPIKGRDGTEKAFYHPEEDRMYFISNRIEPHEVLGLMMHENIHARGKTAIGSQQFNNLLDRVDAMREAGSKPVVEAFNRVPRDTKPENVREEVLAYLIEKYPQHGLVRRFFAQIKAWLHDKGFINTSRLNDADLGAIALNALKSTARGQVSGPLSGEGKGEKAKLSGADNFPGWEVLYRGEYSGNKGGGFFTTDKGFAIQFTQSGRDSEVKTRYVKKSDIYEPLELAYAGDPDAMDDAIAKAKAKGFKAVQLSEGNGQPQSVYVFDRNAIRMTEPSHRDFIYEDEGNGTLLSRQAGGKSYLYGYNDDRRTFDERLQRDTRGGKPITRVGQGGMDYKGIPITQEEADYFREEGYDHFIEAASVGSDVAPVELKYPFRLHPRDQSETNPERYITAEARERAQDVIDSQGARFREEYTQSPATPFFSKSAPEVMAAVRSSISERLDDPKWKDLAERFVYSWLNTNDPRKRVYDAASKKTAKNDMVTAEELRGKKTAAEVALFREKTVEPMLKELAGAKLAVSDLEEYSHALHAPERNQRMREVNAKRTLDKLLQHMTDGEALAWKKRIDDLHDGRSDKEMQNGYLDMIEEINSGLDDRAAGRDLEAIKALLEKWENESPRFSGMTDEEAASIVTKWEADPRKQSLKSAKKKLDQINRAGLDALHESGELSDQEYDGIVDGYQYYVPLMRDGFAESSPTTGRITGPTGKPLKIAMGSMREVVNIVAHSVQNYQTAVNRKHKSAAGKALYEFVLDNPDSGITVEKLAKKPTHDQEGNIVLYPDQKEPDNGVFVKVDGTKHLLEFDTDERTPQGRTLKRFLESIKESGANVGPIMTFLTKVNRYLAAVNTMVSPEFVLSNFVRDFQTAFIHLSDEKIRGDKGFRTKIAKDIFPAIKGIFQAERGNDSSPMSKDYREFAKEGGKIGWMQGYDKIENLAKDLEHSMKLYGEGHITLKKLDALKNLVTSSNTAVENGVRLATYRNLRDSLIAAGRNPAVARRQAASVASKLTVDFTQKGKYGPAFNSLYLFANAGIQGNLRMIKALTGSKQVQKIVGGIVVGGFILQMLALAGGGDDDTGEPYILGLPDFVLERNIIFMIPGSKGKYISIPMPYGYNGFNNIGSEAANILYMGAQGKEYNVMRGAMRVATTFANSFNPLASGTLLQSLSPTIADPIVMAQENKDYTGRDLMPKQNMFGAPKPDSERYWKGASPTSKFITNMVNRITGGDRFKGGAIDMSPETMDMLYDSATGSTGKFVSNILNLPVRAASGELEANRIPFTRRFVGQWDDKAISNKYYEAVEAGQIAKQRLDGAETLVEKRDIRQTSEFRNYIQTKSYESRLSDLRKSLKLAEARDDKTQVSSIRGKILEIQKSFLEKISSK